MLRKMLHKRGIRPVKTKWTVTQLIAKLASHQKLACPTQLAPPKAMPPQQPALALVSEYMASIQHRYAMRFGPAFDVCERTLRPAADARGYKAQRVGVGCGGGGEEFAEFSGEAALMCA